MNSVEIKIQKGNYEPGSSKLIRLLLRRTLVQYNSAGLLSKRRQKHEI